MTFIIVILFLFIRSRLFQLWGCVGLLRSHGLHLLAVHYGNCRRTCPPDIFAGHSQTYCEQRLVDHIREAGVL